MTKLRLWELNKAKEYKIFHSPMAKIPMENFKLLFNCGNWWIRHEAKPLYPDTLVTKYKWSEIENMEFEAYE